jgi:hypothetical protein
MRRVRHQHEISEPFAEIDGPEPREIALAIHVGIDEEEWFAPEKLERVGDAACGLEPLALARVVQAEPKAGAVAQALHDTLAEVRNVDDGVPDARAREALKMPGDERLAASLDERLGNRIGERTQPLAAPGGEKHRLHAASSSSSRTSGASAV